MCLTGCGSDFNYGANFGYPSEPPVPPGAAAVVSAKGWDDDDPMRGREVVIDIGKMKPAKLTRFYRGQFSVATGWHEGAPHEEVGGGYLLCLVRHMDERFDEYVEIYPHNRRRDESSGPSRYLASISRLEAESRAGKRTVDRCGLASIWYPSRL
jgi:hypothetical protein